MSVLHVTIHHSSFEENRPSVVSLALLITVACILLYLYEYHDTTVGSEVMTDTQAGLELPRPCRAPGTMGQI